MVRHPGVWLRRGFAPRRGRRVIGRLLAIVAAYRTWHAGFLIPHLFAAARQPADLEPPSHGDRTDADPGPPGVRVPAVLHPEPGHAAAPVVPHAGAQDDADTSRFFASLRVDDTASLDPVEAVWEQAFRDLDATLDAEVERGRRVLDEALGRLAPGWHDAICERAGCALCVHDFGEAMEAAGVIALPAVAVDWATGEYAAVGHA